MAPAQTQNVGDTQQGKQAAHEAPRRGSNLGVSVGEVIRTRSCPSDTKWRPKVEEELGRLTRQGTGQEVPGTGERVAHSEPVSFLGHQEVGSVERGDTGVQGHQVNYSED